MGLWPGLVLLLVASGLIAYIGDALGRRIGRKRLSILGLRPRNTAILFTVLTGMSIAGLTLGVLLLVSEDIRDRLLTYDEKVARVAELTGEVSRLEGSAAAAREQTDAARRAADQAAGERREAERKLVTATDELAKAEANVSRAARAVAAARAELVQVQARRREAERQRAAAQRAETAARAARDTARRALDQARGSLSKVQGELTQAERELAAAEGELAAATRLVIENDRRYRELGAQVSAAQRDLETAQRQRDSIQGDLDRLMAALREAREQRQHLREADLIAFAGDELARLLVRRGPGPPAERIQDLVGVVNRLARERGAGEWLPGIFAVPSARDGSAEEAVYLDGLLEAVRAELAGGADGLWLRAVARYNTTEGEPVDYEVELYHDVQVFAPGEEIARTEIDGAAEPTEIIRELQRLVQEQVNPTVAERGLLPNADGRYTTVGPEVWYPALERLRALGRRAAVAVVAAEAIRTGEPLRVSFQVAPDG